MAGKSIYPNAITADQWDDLLPYLDSMLERTKAYCRAVLVDGKSVAEVAKNNQLQRQVVNKSVSKVYSIFAKKNDGVKDWVKVTVFVPKVVAQEILELEKREHQSVGLVNSM
ncbi:MULTISPECIES: TrfB-related DNA-binding protein [unclassified Acinetobacter]|uniref:TrfB-related DNA-binding protein n=1 Tax=unclassified Acinetobacter TaxID=196816 RepID=UPI0015D3B37B|nr:MULTISPECIES: TrfB-related DNA-binding protein [unclassified Acinetobacter]UUS62533.1 transcriptional regulator KorA [Acinetobacter sp. YH16056_T]